VELVERALEKKRVLSQMKAELRAQVFLTIDEEETAGGSEGGRPVCACGGGGEPIGPGRTGEVTGVRV